MYDLNKLKVAETYIKAMAEGYNPITNQSVSENDMINNIHISRCLFYVSDVLKSVISKEQRNSPAKSAYFITQEQIETLKLFQHPVYIKELAVVLNTFSDENGCKRFQEKWVSEYMIKTGFMEYLDRFKVATEAGKNLGIITEEKESAKTGIYYTNRYTTAAQQFIIDNIEAIVSFATNSVAKDDLDTLSEHNED